MSANEQTIYPVVNTHNEWDPLEEIIVGIVDGAMVPPWDVIMEATVHHRESPILCFCSVLCGVRFLPRPRTPRCGARFV